MNIDKKDKNLDKNSGGNNFMEKVTEFLNTAIEFVKKYYVYFSAGAAVLIIVIIILIAKGCGASRNHEFEDDTLGSVIAVESDGGSQETAGASEILEDEYPEINALMKEYFSARLSCDTERLSKIVSDTSAISEEKLQRESEYIEDYKNIKCYTKAGLLENTYIVYTYFEYKFYNINTTAPAMVRMYVCTNDSGDVYIFNEAVDGEVANYMEEVNSGEDVTAMFADIDSKLKNAIDSDEDLMNFYTKLLEGSGSSSAEESTEAVEDTTEAETEPETEAETEPETEAETEPETQASGSEVLLDTNDTAFVKEDAVLYSKPIADSQYKVGTTELGVRYKRIGYNDEWSMVELEDGSEAYIKNDYLIIDKEFIYVNETVYAKQTVRVRLETSFDAEIAGTLLEGESVKRIGYNDEWSKVIFEGEICYIGKGFLTTNKPEED